MTAYTSPHVKLMTSYDGIRGQSVNTNDNVMSILRQQETTASCRLGVERN